MRIGPNTYEADLSGRLRLAWAHRDDFDDENKGVVDALTTVHDVEVGYHAADIAYGLEDSRDIAWWAELALRGGYRREDHDNPDA